MNISLKLYVSDFPMLACNIKFDFFRHISRIFSDNQDRDIILDKKYVFDYDIHLNIKNRNRLMPFTISLAFSQVQ